MSRRIKRMHIDPRGLANTSTRAMILKVEPAAGMPADVEYVSCGYDPKYQSLFLILSSDEWPEVAPLGKPGKIDGPLLTDVTKWYKPHPDDTF